jgi:hypothetical protein
VSVPLFVRHRLYTKPTWYPQTRLSESDQAAAANRVDQKLIQARSEIAGMYAQQVRLARAGAATATAPAGEFTLAFTEDEIDSWIPKWKDELGWSRRVDALLTEPAIVLHQREIILAATIKDWNTIVSLHFLPALKDGKLWLTLNGVMAGTLPLPRVSWSTYEQRLLNGVQARLPEFQRNADIDARGRANSSAVSAAMSELLLNTLHDEPAEPVLFLPDQLSRSSRSLPVRITEISVASRTLTLAVRPMDASERVALLRRLRGPYDLQSAQVAAPPAGRAPTP